MTRVSDEPLIVLHTRPYRESSLLVSGFSLNEGRVSLVSRGTRTAGKGRVLQPMSSFRVSWSGRSSLLTLTGFELTAQPLLRGQALAAGFYLAELVSRLISEREAHPRVFAGLSWALGHLADDVEPVLRTFERLLLEDLGYGLEFEREAMSGAPICDERRYRFDPGSGFTLTTAPRGYPGGSILAIARDDYSGATERMLAKRIFRQALAPHLGARPLQSRKLLYRGRS